MRDGHFEIRIPGEVSQEIGESEPGMNNREETSVKLDDIIAKLDKKNQRATYCAVAGVVGAHP